MSAWSYLRGDPFQPADILSNVLRTGVYSGTPTGGEFILSDPAGESVVFQGNFTLDGAGYPQSGTITGFRVYSGTIEVLNVTGYQIDFGAFANALTDLRTAPDGGEAMVHLLLDDQMGAYGSNDSDMVSGGFAADLIFADAGSDYVVGYSGGDRLFGGDGDDLIEALEGRDRLHGDPGNDALVGGRGKDKFYFEDALGPLNVDTVRDFTHGRDKLILDPDIFRRVNDHGALDEDFFRARANAHDRDDHILYDRHTGTLSYDKDGLRWPVCAGDLRDT